MRSYIEQVIKGRRGVFILAMTFALVVVTTNKLYQFEDNTTRISAGDSEDYLMMSQKAPGLPDSHDRKVVNESAQRIFGPIAVGVLAKTFSVTHATVFRVAVVGLVFACVISLFFLLGAQGFSYRAMILGLALYAFNPYALRFTLSFPGMISDLIFGLGLIWLTRALLSCNGLLLIGSGALMILGRQTALATMPCVLACLMIDPGWRRKSSWLRLGLGATFLAVLISAYHLFSFLSADFSTRSALGTQFIFGLFQWIQEQFDVQILAIFVTRGLLTIFLPMVVLLASTRWYPRRLNRPQVITLVLGLSVMAQPYLAGPYITEGSVQRLSVLGLVPLLTFLLLSIPTRRFDSMSPMHFAGLLGLIFLGSFHHNLSNIGFLLLSKTSFPLFHFTLGAIVAFMELKQSTKESYHETTPCEGRL